MTYYLKYRPQNLDELDLESVRETLKKIVGSGNIPHAFLFAGPKGTGKTSAARIIAKIVNCDSKDKPCNKCDQCKSITAGSNIDVIEMDAASHRGIDDVRTLKEAVKLAPARASKKIYIIDEAHMLTTEASNALLKTLEEPPKHVMFILATTNPEKLIETIKSRTTIIQFKKATKEEIKNSLKRIITGEKIKIKDGQLDQILSMANGGFRDATKILEQFKLEGEEILKGTNTQVEETVDLFFVRDKKSLLNIVSEVVKKGESVELFIKNILTFLQTKLLEEKVKSDETISLMELLIDANSLMDDSPIEELPLQIAIVKWCGDAVGDSGGSDTSENEEKQKTKGLKNGEVKNLPQMNNHLSEKITDEIWKKILSMVKPVNASIEALLRSAHPEGYDGRVLSLNVYYKFHKERLEDIKNRKILEDILAGVLGNPTKFECMLVTPPIREISKEVKVETILTEGEDQDIIKVAEEIFSS